MIWGALSCTHDTHLQLKRKSLSLGSVLMGCILNEEIN